MIAFKKQRRAWRWTPDMARNTASEVDRLVRENFGLAKWFARGRAGQVGPDAAISAATDGLLRAAQTFDPTRGATFASHAYAYMRGFVSHEVKRRRAEKRGFYFDHVSMEHARPLSVPFIYPEEL